MGKKIGYMLSFLAGAGLAGICLLKLQQGSIDRWKGLAEKNRGLFLLMDQWVRVRQDGRKLEEYFIRNSYKRIAVYGMGYVGRRLVEELKDSEIETVYGIDRNAANIYSEIKVVTMDEELANVDVVVVTLVDDFDQVSDLLSKELRCPVIAIEDIVNEI